jgi:hypothetical protein
MRRCSIIRIALFLLVFLIYVFNSHSAVQDQEFSPGSYNTLRIENEGKLVVPVDKIEEVWQYLLERFVTDKSFIKSLNPDLDSFWDDEYFVDNYFDSPDLKMLDKKSSIRYRRRINLTDPNNKKSGRELVQIKLSGIDGNIFNRGEFKFPVKPSNSFKTEDDIHPLIGLIDRQSRTDFKERVVDLGLDPYSLKAILTIEQHRRSIYILHKGKAFISMRLDDGSSKLLWSKWHHVEIEPELNEIPYTQGDTGTREAMQKINQEIMDDIFNKFPYIKMDLTPKYNKAFDYFQKNIPLLRFLIRVKIL